MQGLKELHSRGRAHCDIKSGNVRVVVGVGACIIRCTFVDMGGSVVFAGKDQLAVLLICHKCTCPKVAATGQNWAWSLTLDH